MAFLNSRAVKLAMEARKKMEQEKQLLELEIENSKKIAQRTAFEVTTTAKIERRLRGDSLQSKKDALARELYNRRTQLADLYSSEMDFWRSEVSAQKETMAERKAMIMERAYALRDAREAARKKMIQDKLDQLWRDGCDDARTLDSKELNKFMGAERLRQIEEKENRRKNAKAEETVFLGEWTRQLSLLEEKDRAKQAKRDKSNADTAAGLEEQIRFNDELKAQHFKKMQEDDEREISEVRFRMLVVMLLSLTPFSHATIQLSPTHPTNPLLNQLSTQLKKQQQVRQALADEASLREKLQLEAIQRGKDVQAFNEQYKDLRRQEMAIEAERDAVLLQEALKKERDKIAEENAKAEAGYEAARQYRKYLEELMLKEKADNGFMDDVVRKESEKVWKARDDALKAREDARAYLMKLVNEGRQQQIAIKKQAVLQEKENDRRYASKFIDDIKDGISKDKQAADLRRKMAEEHNVQLMEQIAERRRQEEIAKQAIYLEDKKTKHIELIHQERLKQQAGHLRLQFPLRKPDY